MEHPILKTSKNIIFYFALWIVISLIHFVVISFFYEQPFFVASVDSIFFNLLFALFGLVIWFPIIYYKPAKATAFNIFINQMTSATVIILIWQGLGYLILKNIFYERKDYQSFLYTSIPWRIIGGLFYYSIIILIYYLIIYYENLQEKLTNEIKLNEKIREAELNLLKSQINPHFLFNSLNSVSSLTITNPEKAQEMVIKLSDFLRYSVTQSDTKLTTLDSEINNIKRYLEIEQVRFGNKLLYEYDMTDNCQDATIPLMILQPLYENAVKHGVYESTEQIKIITKCNLKENFLIINITNNFEKGTKSKKGAGIGLNNIKDRLKLIYKSDGLIKTKLSDNFFEVQLYIPQNVVI